MEIGKFKTKMSSGLMSSEVSRWPSSHCFLIWSKEMERSWVLVAHACNPSYSEAEIRRIGSKPAQANSLRDPILKIHTTKQGWCSSSSGKAPSKSEALSSNPTTAKREQRGEREKEREREREREREKEIRKELSGLSFVRILIPFMKTSHSWPNHFPKIPFL
jgi:hypothetical protein